MKKAIPKFDRSVSLVCWAYNEEDLIRGYLERAAAFLDERVIDYEIVLVDDASTDRTHGIALDFQRINPRLKIIRNKKNMNVGWSSRRAIAGATKEYLFWQPIDWCYDIAHLRQYLEYLKTYDIVVGVRRDAVRVRLGVFKPIAGLFKLFGIKHLTRRSDTVPKAFVSVINYTLIRILFRVPLSDFQNLTFYPSRWIQSIHFEARSSFVSPEALIKSYWQGMSMKEVPINFIPRDKGQAKGAPLRVLMSSFWDVVRLWFRWYILRRFRFVRRGQVVRFQANRKISER